ncbi:MAG TPA: LCP family protein [Ktedonobacterales bacterium]
MTSTPPGWSDHSPASPTQDGWGASPERPRERHGPLAVFGPGVAWTAQDASRSPGSRLQAPPLPPPQRSARRTQRLPKGPVIRLLGVAVVLALCVVSVAMAVRLYSFGSAISPNAPLSSQTGYVGGTGRVNIAVLGYGGAGHDGAYLSDSIMVISLMPSDHATTMISVPRDLWVQVPPGSGQYSKLNTAFQDGMNNGYNPGSGRLPPGPLAGGEEAAAKVSDITGLNVPYFMSINFQGFREVVNALGGVDINVPVAFTAQYPINDDPQINAGWKTIHFNTGWQHMDGERAIEYARARYVLDPPSEGSDFARSARQQLLIRAIVSRLRSPTAWPGLASAMDALQRALYTNLSLTDLAAFTLKLDLSHAAHIGLTDSNVLVDAQSADGQDILLPRNDDWIAVRQYIASQLAS